MCQQIFLAGSGEPTRGSRRVGRVAVAEPVQGGLRCGACGREISDASRSRSAPSPFGRSQLVRDFAFYISYIAYQKDSWKDRAVGACGPDSAATNTAQLFSLSALGSSEPGLPFPFHANCPLSNRGGRRHGAGDDCRHDASEDVVVGERGALLAESEVRQSRRPRKRGLRIVSVSASGCTSTTWPLILSHQPA